MSIASNHPCALVSKQRIGKKISYCYDPAKTPLQRLLAGILPIETQQDLNEGAQSLDPVRLLEQLHRLQQALFHCAAEANPFVSPAAVVPLRVFAVETCTTGGVPARESIPDLSGGLPTLYQQQEKRKRVLGWRRTQKDPFEGAWEQIASWVQANPERRSGDIFRELQRLSPGRYQPLQIRTLQRGMRKIRAFLLETPLEPWPEDVIQGQASDPVEPAQWTHEEGGELRVSDVNQEDGILTVRGKGSKLRQVPLGQNGRHALLSYLDQRCPETREDADQIETCEDPPFSL